MSRRWVFAAGAVAGLVAGFAATCVVAVAWDFIRAQDEDERYR